MPPPPAEQLASRLFLGPALRAQPDRRLVTLVREGYEAAFEEIDRRYRRPLDRFAASIVGGHSEDVTQDALSKALLALRGSDTEIELRPWLYRIVRNTALNHLRDRPPATDELGESIAGGRSAAIEAERREELNELMGRLRALPEPQRAAIVMRELEGLSHDEIAASLGVTGGAARQAIHRARIALRDGLGLMVPLPVLRALIDHGSEAVGGAAGGAVAAAGTAAAAGGPAGATLGGIGAGGALKVGIATALIAGSVGAGVAIQHDRSGNRGPTPAAASAMSLPSGSAESGGPASTQDGATDRGVALHTAEDRGQGGSGRGGGQSGDRRSGNGGPGGGDSGGSEGGGSGSSGEDAGSPSPPALAGPPLEDHGGEVSGSGSGSGGSDEGSDGISGGHDGGS